MSCAVLYQGMPQSLVAVMSSLLLLFLFCFGGQSQLIPNKYGELQGTNLDPAFIGETVVFKCVITDDSLLVNSSAIWIRRPNTNTSIGRIVNQTATSATIEVKVTSPSDAGMYYCTLSTPGGDFGLGFAWVNVDYPLAPVTDLNCTVPPGRTQLGCTYTLPLPYRHPEYLLGCVYFYTEEDIQSRNICFSGLDRNFSLPAGNSLYSNYTFQIQLWHNRRNVSKVSKEFTVLPIEVVIPPPVDNVRVTDRRARRLELSWQQLDLIIAYVYRVTYTAVWGNVKQISTVQTKSTEIVLRELSPCTNYSILVQGRESELVAGYWSQGGPVTVRTLADAPGRAPRVSPAVSGTDDGRVVVYWQLLSRKEENGEMQGYSVQCEDEGERRVGPGRFSATLDIPSDRRGLWCDVYAVNNVGMSPSSSLYIPSRRSELSLRDFWVAGGEGDSNITFLWDLVGREQHNCAAYWCQAADLTNLCQTSVQWEIVACDQQNLTLDTGHVIADQRLMVGFSAQLSAPGGPVWSSIKWQYCVYEQHKVPPAPDGFQLSPSQPPLSVHVEWRPPDCRQNPAHITSYLLSYCPVSGTADHCSGSSWSIVVDGDAISYLISDLEPGAIYKVNIRAVSQVLQGPWSAPVMGRVEDAARPLKIILAVTGCFLSIPVFILCFHIVKRARSSWRRGHSYWYPSFVPLNAYDPCPKVESDEVEVVIDDTGPGHVVEEASDDTGPGQVVEEASDDTGPGHVVEVVIDDTGPGHVVQEASDDTGPGHVVQEASDDTGPGHVVQEASDDTGPGHVVEVVIDDTGPGHVVQEVIDDTGPGHVVQEVIDDTGPGHVVEEVIDDTGPGHVVQEVIDDTGPGQVVQEVIDDTGPGQSVEEVINYKGPDHVVEEVIDDTGPGHVVEEVIDDTGPGQVVQEVIDDTGPGQVVEEVINYKGPDHVVQEVIDDTGPGQVLGEVTDDGRPGHVVVEVTDDCGGAINVLGEAMDNVSDTVGKIGPLTRNGTRTHLLKDHASVKNSEYVFNMSQADSNKSPPHSNQSYSKLTLTDEWGC